MAYSARIDELEKKFSENARRYFAPLANEYRKAGDLDRAIEICRAHLPQQPGHMSGHVVYGQALYESRQLEEAKTVFEAALGLDPENLIALRHLGDIARDSSDPVSARTWYLRVLDADPRNDEVAGMLAELDAAAQATPAEAPPVPAEGAAGWGDINPERGAAEVQGATESSSPRAADNSAAAEAEGDSVAKGQEQQAAAPGTSDVADVGLEPMPSDSAAGENLPDEDVPVRQPAGFEAREDSQRPASPSLDRMLNDAFAPDEAGAESEAEPDARAVTAFGRPGLGDGETAPGGRKDSAASSSDEGPALDDSAFAEVDALFDEISPPSEKSGRATGSAPSIPDPQSGNAGGAHSNERPRETKVPSAGALTGDAMFGDVDLGAGAEARPSEGDRVAGLETREFIPPARASAPSDSRRDTGSMAVTGLTSFEQPSGEDSSTRAAFVTETMAELYLQQGFTAEALDIYRQLLEQNPEDANLRERIEHLERGGKTSLSVAAVSSEVIEAAQQRHAARPVRTVRSFFGRLAGHQVQPREATEAEETEPFEPSMAPQEDMSSSPAGRASQELPVSSPDGGAAPTISIISDLFQDGAVSEADEAAASMLASAFSPSFKGGDDVSRPGASAAPAEMRGHTPASGSGKAAHTAGRELSLDQVFRDSSARTQRKSGGYSFDQFFSDGSQGGGAGRATPAEGSGTSASEGEPEGDLEQFTAWLEGLKRK